MIQVEDRDVAGTYDLVASNLFGEVVSQAARLDVFVVDPSIGVGVEAETLGWRIIGDSDWFVQSDTTFDGVDAIQSGIVSANQHSSVEMEIPGPVSVEFAWKVSSELGFDFLSVEVDGEERNRILGEIDWERVSIFVPEGKHLIRWTYSKDGRGSVGTDAGWLDDVQVIPLDSDVPLVILHPERYGVAEGGTLVLEGKAVGSFPLNYQWLRNGEIIPEAIEALLVIEQVGLEDAGDYSFTVSNAFGMADSRSESVTVFRQDDPIGQVLDLEGLDWREIDAEWIPTVDGSFDGNDAMRSATIGNGQVAPLELGLEGPVTVSFSWRVSSELFSDYARLYVDGLLIAERSGSTPWEQYVVELSPGDHVIRWAYEKDSSRSVGADRAWLDQLSIVSGIRDYSVPLDSDGFIWTSAGVALWDAAADVTDVGGKWVHSPKVDHNQESSIGTSLFIETPQIVSFRWRVSSETGFDHLLFFVNGSLANQITGDGSWKISHALVPPGRHDLRWVYKKDGEGTGGADKGWLDYVTLSPYEDVSQELGQAVDAQGLALFSFGGGGGWQSQSEVTVDGEDALVSGETGDADESLLQGFVEGPCVLRFQWKVSSEQFFDLFAVAVDGRVEGVISGELDWTSVELPISSGRHFVQWVYRRDAGGGAGSNQGWLDQFECVAFNTDYNEATEGDGFVWNIGGVGAWYSDSLESAVGGDVLRSPSFEGSLFGSPLLAGRSDIARVGFEGQGPGTLHFSWKRSANTRNDFFSFSVDGIFQNQLQGDQDWTEAEFSVGPGQHQFQWDYSTSARGFGRDELDVAYLDNIRFDTLSDPFDAWRRRNFSEADFENMVISGPNGDPDSDGVTNLGEFAFGMSPRSGGTDGVPRVELSSGGLDRTLTLIYRLNEADPRLVYDIEESLDLQTWIPYEGGIRSDVRQPIVAGLVEVRLELNEPIEAAMTRFYRIAIRRTP